MKKKNRLAALVALFSLAIFAGVLSAQTTTPNVGLQIPNYGQNNWYIPVNYNWNKLDQLLGGTLAVPNFAITGTLTVDSVVANHYNGVDGGSFPTISGSPTPGQCSYWVTSSTLGGQTCATGGGTPGGSNLQLQYNSAGTAFGGSAALATDAAHQALYINSLNPTPNASPCSFTPALCVAGLWNSSSQAAAEADPIGIAIQPTFAYGPGFSWGNAGVGGWSTQKALYISMNDYTRGITQLQSDIIQKLAVGDTANYHYVLSTGGSTAQSDEGVCGQCTHVIQLNNFYKGTVTSTQTTGTQTLAATILSNVLNTQDGGYLINRTTGAVTGGYFVPTGVITAWSYDGAQHFVMTMNNSLIVGQTLKVDSFVNEDWINVVGTVTARTGTTFNLTVSGLTHGSGSASEIGAASWSPFQIAGTAAMAGQVGGITLTPTSARGTVNTVMPVTGTQSPPVFTLTVDVTDDISAFPTTPNLVGCLTGGQPEQVKFTAAAASGGHQSVSITYREPHGVASVSEATTLWYGGPCGKFIDVLAQTSASRPQGTVPSTYFVVGAIDASHIAYAWNIRGGTTNNGISTLQRIVPYTTALRTGSTVTASIEGGYNGNVFNGVAAATVVASTNSAFLGTATSPARTLNGIGIGAGITFTQTGTNGDTATAMLVSLPTSADAFNEYCGAEIAAPSTPAGGTPTTINLEPNNCAWNSGDSVWGPPNPTFNMEGNATYEWQYTPSNQGNSQGWALSMNGPGVDANFTAMNITYGNPITAYAGHGGTMNAGQVIHVGGLGSGPNWGSVLWADYSGIGGQPFIRIDADEYGTNHTFQSIIQVESGSIAYYNDTATWFMNNLSAGTIAGTSITGPLNGNLFGNAVGTRANYFCMEVLTTSTCTDGLTNNNYQQSGIVFQTGVHNIIGPQYGQGGDMWVIGETPGNNSPFLAGFHVYGDIYLATPSRAGQIIMNGTNPHAYLTLDGTIGSGCQGSIMISNTAGGCSVGGYSLQVGDNFLSDTATITGATPTAPAGGLGLGGTTAASTSCGSLVTATGCLKVNIGGTDRFIPFY